MLKEDHNLLLVQLMFKAAERGISLPVSVLRRNKKNSETKRFFVEIQCDPNILLIKDGSMLFPNKVSVETSRFIYDTLMFHDLNPRRDRWSHADKEKYLMSSYDVGVFKKSNSHILSYKYINVKNIEISKTALILFGDSEIVRI